MNRDDAIRQAAEPVDWTEAQVDRAPRAVSMVYSTRLPDDLSTWLEEEATRRGINPSALLRELVGDARRVASEDRVVTLRMSDLHQAIEQIAERAA